MAAANNVNLNAALNTLYEQIPHEDSTNLDTFFMDVLYSIPVDRVERAEQVRKYLFEGQALPESFPAAYLVMVNNYKIQLDSKSEGLKHLLHELYKQFQIDMNATAVALPVNYNDGANNANNYGNNNILTYVSNVNEENFLNEIHGHHGHPRRSRTTRKTRKTKGGKRRRRNTHYRK